MKRTFFRTTAVFLLGLLVLFVFHQATFAGTTGKISGKIVDAETGVPLPGANVVIKGTLMGGATDLDGDYFIINVPPGNYTLTASMMGYETLNKTGVSVSIDRTMTVDFDLKMTVIEGEAVTVVATKEIVPMDVSASQIVAEPEQMVSVPLVSDVSDFINMQVGIEDGMIRGGGLDQTQFMMDGLMVVDNRSNSPMVMVNLSSVQELSIIKGGFNAEYGNVRSGLINIVTKEGDQTGYHGSVDFRFSPAHLKHTGVSLFDQNNFYLRPYLDPAVCYVGTMNGSWSEELQGEYQPFIGWNAMADKVDGMGPDDLRNLFMWRTRAEGSDALMPSNYEALTGREKHEGEYGNKPDWNMDVSFGGPVPLIGSKLGNMSFFASYRNNWESFALPQNRDYYKEENSLLKLTSRLSPSMKLTVEGLYGEINSIASGRSGVNTYLTGGENIFNHMNERRMGYWPASLNPFDIYRSMVGLSFDHILSPSTFYNIRITNTRVKNACFGPYAWRDTTNLVQFGDHWADEEPYGFYFLTGRLETENDQDYSGEGSLTRDYSSVSTMNMKFDMTSQVNKYNQVKVGFDFNYDDIYSDYGNLALYSPNNGWWIKWDQKPYRLGAYLQDKLEFEGMIANFGLRMDYNNPNTEWYTADRYSEYFNIVNKEDFTTLTPKEPASGKVKLSPRLGVSHPISSNAKLFFNYGHFYSMPSSDHMYRINYRPGTSIGVSSIGNPSADLPKTVAYELGLDYNIGDLFLVHLAGYYKDVTGQTSWIRYVNRDHSINYSTIANQNYADIRGLEVRVDKRWGQWITGWIHYNYMVTTSGFVGREVYYEDEMDALLYGIHNPYQERPLARPLFRANVLFKSPGDFGPVLAGMNPLGNLHLSVLFNWKAGRHVTWDPLETYDLQQNLQWKGRYNIDAKISKQLSVSRYNFTLFVDIKNVFNTKYLWDASFYDGEDMKRYYESLHLPMYEGKEYQEAGFTAGDDKPGDVKSDDKPYINMPNRKFLHYIGLRSFFVGLKLDF